jgi:hypothetical protein
VFAYAETPVTFVALLLLFAFCTAWCAYELTRPQDARQRVSNLLHLVMAVVMLLMVAPPTWSAMTSVVPTFGLVAGFALSTVWFGWLAWAAHRASDRSGRLHFLGHAAMFGAMTWHLSAMGVMEAAMAQPSGHDMGGMDMGSGMGAGPMDMGQWMQQQSLPGGTLWVFALVGVPFMAYLLASGLRSLWLAFLPRAAAGSCPCGPGCTCGPECSCHANHAVAQPEVQLVASGGRAPLTVIEAPPATAHSCHEVRPVGSTSFRVESLAAFAMNVGMFWMSTGLLVPLLPFFAAFAF